MATAANCFGNVLIATALAAVHRHEFRMIFQAELDGFGRLAYVLLVPGGVEIGKIGGAKSFGESCEIQPALKVAGRATSRGKRQRDRWPSIAAEFPTARKDRAQPPHAGR